MRGRRAARTSCCANIQATRRDTNSSRMRPTPAGGGGSGGGRRQRPQQCLRLNVQADSEVLSSGAPMEVALPRATVPSVVVRVMWIVTSALAAGEPEPRTRKGSVCAEWLAALKR